MDTTGERWAGGTAVITGAGSGLGAGMARAAAGYGMSVVLADINGEGVEKVASELASAGTRAEAVQTDVSDFVSVERLAGVAFDRFGDVRLLANNAGVEQVSLLWEDSPSAWQRLIGVNLTGVYHGIRAFIPRLIEAGKPATVINTASIASFTSGPYQGMYQVSKRGVQALSECLTAELETVHAPIQVSVVFPAAVRTQIFTEAEDLGEAAGGMMTTLRDMLTTRGMDPDEAGALILRRAGEGHRWISTNPQMAEGFARMLSERLDDIVTDMTS
jgi:NAD(P)-dependent dehydrogenase (short-subunit alcohol dehydrogenase family)